MLGNLDKSLVMSNAQILILWFRQLHILQFIPLFQKADTVLFQSHTFGKHKVSIVNIVDYTFVRG